MTEIDESSRHYYGWLVVAVCFIAIAVASGARLAFGVLLDPLIEAFDASRTAVSVTQSVQLLAYAVSQPVMGRLIDHYGLRSAPAPIRDGSHSADCGGMFIYPTRFDDASTPVLIPSVETEGL